MSKGRAVIVGYGNIGRFALDALLEAPDLEPVGIVRRRAVRDESIPGEIPVTTDVDQLGPVDVALLCVPTRSVPETAERYLAAGINTVDSFDLHGDELVALRRRLHEAAQAHGSVAVVSAGWDPGTDSVLRALLEAMAPRGITYTNFGPGVSMGHSTVVRAIEGVADAVSVTVPVGAGGAPPPRLRGAGARRVIGRGAGADFGRSVLQTRRHPGDGRCRRYRTWWTWATACASNAKAFRGAPTTSGSCLTCASTTRR